MEPAQGAIVTAAIIRVVPETPPSVVVDDDSVRVDGYVEYDPEVVRVLGEAEDPVLALHHLLVVGAHASLGVSTTINATLVEHRFDKMAGQFDQTVTQAVDDIGELADRLLDDGGAIPAVLASVKDEIAGILAETFDEDSRTSALARIDDVVSQAQASLAKAVRSDLDPDVAGSPMARVKNDIVDVVRHQVGTVVAAVQELGLELARDAGRAEVRELTSAKGFSFEDLLEGGVGELAAGHGDCAERIGTTTGAAGNQKGDLLVTLNASDTAGAAVRFVIEAKDTRLTMPKARAAIDAAMANHEAGAALLVFAVQEQAPVTVPFMELGCDRAIVVYDKHDPDPYVLRFAYLWARSASRRNRSADPEALDWDRIDAAIQDAAQALAAHRSVKSCLTSAKKQIDEAAGHVAILVDKVETALAILAQELVP
jgi:hypothetical protein